MEQSIPAQKKGGSGPQTADRSRVRRRDVSRLGLRRAGEAFLHRQSAPPPAGHPPPEETPAPHTTSHQPESLPGSQRMAVRPPAKGRETTQKQAAPRTRIDDRLPTKNTMPPSGTPSVGITPASGPKRFELPPLQTARDREIGLGRVLTAIERREISREEGRRLYGLIGTFHRRRQAIR
ncbi:MAG: hypothetical protein HQL63_09575 [Magnetococcales bacterium]|nr:hypothetical protein [Magnetococcales bacterium]